MSQLIKDKTAIGASAPLLVNMAKDHTVEVAFGQGETPSAVTVDLEGAIREGVYYTLQSYSFSAGDLTAKRAMFHVVNKPVNFVRLNLVTLTGVGTIQGFYEGK